MKLYVVFDNIKLDKDNSRKCMIELRPEVPGNYKGLIFCNSIAETEIVLNQVKKILYNNFIARGMKIFKSENLRI